MPVLPLLSCQSTHAHISLDLAEADKPWRLPGADQTDFFNYGFDEFTWASYCLKQGNLRQAVKDEKKQVEEMQNMFGTGAAPNAPAMPNMGEMEMQQMMQAMMTSGQDPSTMGFEQFMQFMPPAAQGMGGPGYGGQPQGQQQQMGVYGYGGQQDGGRQGNKGRGGRRW